MAVSSVVQGRKPRIPQRNQKKTPNLEHAAETHTTKNPSRCSHPPVLMVSSWSPGGLLLVLVLVVSWCSSALLVVSCWSFGRLLVSRRSLASLSVVLLVVSCSWSLSSWSPWSQRSSWVVTWRRCRKPQLATSCDLCFPEQFRAVYGLSLFGGLCWHIGSGYAVRNLLGTVRRQHVVILSLKSCIFLLQLSQATGQEYHHKQSQAQDGIIIQNLNSEEPANARQLSPRPTPFVDLHACRRTWHRMKM